MPTVTPQLQLETLFSLNGNGRIISTREPHPLPGPAFIVIRGASACAWAVRADMPNDLAEALNALAVREPTSTAWDRPPLHAPRYREILGGGRVRWGPAFAFPERLGRLGPAAGRESRIDDERSLECHFSGWVAGEIAAGRAPVMAVSDEGGRPVSVCFCARRSDAAAEAGVETAAPFRGRGYAPRATAAWAEAVREMGLTPLYSTDWDNRSSLAVVRKLGLVPFATDWSIV